MNIKIGMLSIPCMILNLANSPYNYEALHQFSSCCGEKVKYNKVCEGCGKTLTMNEIKKGTNKEHILTDSQQERLKELLENSTIEVLSIKDMSESILFDIMPFIQKAQIILPSIRKGYKKSEFKTYYGFVNGLRELNKYCVAKLITRGKEHLVILSNYKADFMLFEIPFARYYNNSEVDRLKQAVRFEVGNMDINEFSTQAKQFIGSFNKSVELDEVTETKKELLKTYLEVVNSNKKEEAIEKDEDNCPFSIALKK